MTLLRLGVHAIAWMWALVAALFIFAKYHYQNLPLRSCSWDLALFFASAAVVGATWGGE